MNWVPSLMGTRRTWRVLHRDATIVDLTNDDDDEDDMNVIKIAAGLDEEDDLGSVASLD